MTGSKRQSRLWRRYLKTGHFCGCFICMNKKEWLIKQENKYLKKELNHELMEFQNEYESKS